MPSRFPGMDPYLESPDIWPDFHHAFASEISAELNGTLPEPYYARLRSRPEIGILEEKPRCAEMTNHFGTSSWNYVTRAAGTRW